MDVGTLVSELDWCISDVTRRNGLTLKWMESIPSALSYGVLSIEVTDLDGHKGSASVSVEEAIKHIAELLVGRAKNALH